MIPLGAPRDILILAPHTDDGEFGAGGSIHRWVSEGHRVHYVAFSDCEDSLPPGVPSGTLREEVREATQVLGIDASQLTILGFTVRRFDTQRQDILQAMVELQRDLDPDLVLMPAEVDLHQDHHVIAKEGLRAFKRTSILAYEVPWNNVSFTTSGFVTLEEDSVETKIEAVKCYRSQAHRTYASEEYLRSHLRFRGTQIGRQYAEAFDVIRWVL